MTHVFRSLLLIGATSTAAAAQSQLSLPSLFSDHVVLQREKPIHVWGEAAPAEAVEVRFHDQKLTATADALGYWQLWLAPERAGGPYTLTVHGAPNSTPINRTDILVGDVWIASGQSNMEMPLTGFTGAPLLNQDQEIANANQPTVRLLLQSRRTSPVVLSNTDAAWTLCTPETARSFSAVAYFFGREISKSQKVPVGLIDTTWGGTPAHAWMSSDAIGYYNLTSVMTDAGQIARDQGRADALKARYAAEDAAAKAANTSPAQHPRPANDHNGSWAPATLFNGMVAPYTRFTIKGAIWYQGETDTTPLRAPNYARVFSSLIQDWRTQWNQGQFPFYFVQISSYSNNNSGWPTTRDQQRLVAETVPNSGMAVIVDAGLTGNIHPPDKQTVGHRLALLARAHTYGESIAADSPTPVRATTEQGRARVWFDHAEGLHPVSAEAGEFEVAGEDGKFYPATTTVDGTTILAQSPSVPNPKTVRYGWKGTLTSFIVNGAGLPMGTFTMDIR